QLHGRFDDVLFFIGMHIQKIYCCRHPERSRGIRQNLQQALRLAPLAQDDDGVKLNKCLN
ncbi:hypothetical protein ABTD96_20740, partial [Acinetobacter baumannii]